MTVNEPLWQTAVGHTLQEIYYGIDVKMIGQYMADAMRSGKDCDEALMPEVCAVHRIPQEWPRVIPKQVSNCLPIHT